MITEKMREELINTKLPIWATIIPSRSTKGVVALHKTEGHAKNAVRATGGTGRYNQTLGGYPVNEAEVYRLVHGQWELVWSIEKGTYPHELPWRDTESEKNQEIERMSRQYREARDRASKAAQEARERYDEFMRAQGES